MAVKRLVSVDFWTDDKIVDRFSPEDKYFMLYILTNPHTTQLGIYKLNIKYAAFETGYSVETIRSLIERFEKHLGIIYYSSNTGEIAIKNYLIHSIIKGGKPVADLLWKEINDVNNKDLILMVFNHIKDSDKINQTVRNVIDIYINKYNNFNDNHNENENDKSYPLSSHDSSHDSSHEPQPPITLLLNTGDEYPIMQEDIDTFKTTYESIEPLLVLKNISAWLSANPQKRRTAEDTKLLIFRWLNEENQKARNNPTTSKYPRKKPNSFHNFHQREYDPEEYEKMLLTTNPWNN